jgi:hypothetical protein
MGQEELMRILRHELESRLPTGDLMAAIDHVSDDERDVEHGTEG